MTNEEVKKLEGESMGPPFESAICNSRMKGMLATAGSATNRCNVGRQTTVQRGTPLAAPLCRSIAAVWAMGLGMDFDGGGHAVVVTAVADLGVPMEGWSGGGEVWAVS